jgi:uncharacterized membrane protein YeaQ/YmgE (transglycosylase-associated protein family)
MRIPWLGVGLLGGILAGMLILPLCSDSTGSIQSAVIVMSLLGGLVAGFLLDALNSQAQPPKSS